MPTGTPKAVITRLHAEITQAQQFADTRERLLNLGGDIVAGTPEDLGRTMRAGADKWGSLVRAIEAQGRCYGRRRKVSVGAPP